MVQVCRCDRCLDQIVSTKLLCKQVLPNDLFKTIAYYSQYLVYSDREKAIKFQTIIKKIPVLPWGVLEAKRAVGNKSLKQHLNFQTYDYLRMAMLSMKYIHTPINSINDISAFRGNRSYDDIYETMRAIYKKPFTITIEELAIMFFSDYFKRWLNENEEVEFMIKMLNRIFA